MEYFLEKKINKKRPEGMPRWKWHEQLDREKDQKEKLIQDQKEFLSFLPSKEKKKSQREYRFSILALLFALLPLILLIIFILICVIRGSCPNIGESVPSEYECRQNSFSPECQNIYYSNPLR